MKAAWLSANLFGYELLKEALAVGQPDIRLILTLSPASRTKMYDPVDPEKWYEFDIPVCEISDINAEINLLQSHSIDMIIMCGWRQIINKKLMNAIPAGIIGFHPTKLPQGRGPAPIINTILEGWQKSAVTMYYITEGLDDGDIIGQEEFFIGPDDYAMDLYYKIIKSGKKLVRIHFPKLAQGTASRIPQNTDAATYFPKRTLADNEIQLQTDRPDLIYRKIRAFSRPYNGAYIIKEDTKIIIWRAEIGEKK